MATSLLPDCGLSTEKFTHWLLVMCGQEKMILKYMWGKWEEGSGKTEKDPRGKHCCYLSDGYLYICLHKLSRELQRTTVTTCIFLSSHMYSGNIISISKTVPSSTPCKCASLLSVAAINSMTKSDLEIKGFIWFMLAGGSSSLRETMAGTHAASQAGTMEERCSLACSFRSMPS